MNTFTLIPILGLKTDVLPDDPNMVQMLGDNTALSHAADGESFSLKRKRNACVKSLGLTQKSNTANAQKTLCMGMFELYDGTNRNYFYFDNGLVYKYDSSWDPGEVTVATPVTFANDSGDLYSIIRVGAYIVWADRAEHTPHKWKNGDANSTTLIASGTAYKFRYLGSFQRRVIGLYSDQTDGNIDVRWSTDWPATAITSLNFPAANQLYIPNDDPITGGGNIGRNRFYIFCENSIQQMVYYPDYTIPFRIYTMVPNYGSANHHSIVEATGGLHFFNPDLKFCFYDGSLTVIPTSDDIEPELKSITPAYYPLIVGKHKPDARQILWTVPLDGSSSCNAIVTYNYDTKQWEIESKTTRWIDRWLIYSNQTWTTLASLVGGTGLWSDAGEGARWADYTIADRFITYGHTDGHLYIQSSEANDGADFEGYRVEPILYFGNKRRYDRIQEIWFDIGESGAFSITVQHRSGNTVGEVVDNAWTTLGTISCDNPKKAWLPVDLNARLHQIKWGTSSTTEKFVVNGIIFKYTNGSEV